MTEKGKLLKEFNEAFAANDSDLILENVTDDIKWTVHGDFSIQGKEDVSKALKEMESHEAYELTIKNIITHGKSAAVDGTMKSESGKTYAFCDVYKFSGFKNPKIKEMTSYVLEVKKG